VRIVREERRYPALSAISTVLKVVAVIVAVVGVVSAIGSFFIGLPALTALGTFIATLIGTAISALVLWAIAELILVVIDIEHNTFLTSQQPLARMEERRPPEERKAA